MYALFPLLLTALACGLLGSWLMADGRARRRRDIRAAGWCLIGVLPLVLAGLLATSVGPAVVRPVLLVAAAALIVGAGALAALGRLGTAARAPSRPGFLGPVLLIPAVGVIALCYLLSVLLALSNGTLQF